MINILQLMLNQFAQKPQTYIFPDQVPIAENYRGLVKNDFESCIGCGTCATICPSEAVKVKQHPASFEWSYDPGACTFCSRCVDYCPAEVLKMDSVNPPIYECRETLMQNLTKPYPACSVCGKTALPVNATILKRVFSDVSLTLEAWTHLCQDCRQKRFHIELLDIRRS